MKKKFSKFLGVGLALVLVCSFSLVTAVPAGGAIAGSMFTVTDGTYSTTPTGAEPFQTGDIGATLTGTWWDSAVIGEFTATGTGSIYGVEVPESGTTVTVDVSGALSELEITFSGTAVRTAGDPITNDAFDTIEGNVIIQPDGSLVADLVGAGGGGTYSVNIDMTGSMVRPVIIERTAVSFLTIQDAINAAVTDDIISVAAGIYDECLAVNESVSIVGVGVSEVTINTSGLEVNNAGIYVSADNVSLQGFTQVGNPTTGLPRYGIKFGEVSGGSVMEVLAKDNFRTGFDFLGTENTAVSDIESRNNVGHGIQLCDCTNITLSNVTVSENGWEGVNVATWGEHTTLGTSGIVFSGTNSFVDVFQLEEGDFSNLDSAPAGDAIITYSTNLADGADVTVQASDFGYALHGDQNDGPGQNRVWFFKTLAEAQAVASVPLGHFDGNGIYIESLTDRTQLYISPGCEIQAAIDAANPEGGDTITVAAGTYNENITIDRTLTLEGAQAGENAFERTGPESIIDAQLADFAVFIIGAETVATLDGFTVLNYEVGGILAGAFSPPEDDPLVVHILNNVVEAPSPLEDAHNNNIQMGDGTTGTVIGNEVSGAHLEHPDWSGSGIIVASTNGVLISNNHAYSCDIGIAIIGYTHGGRTPSEGNIIEYNDVESCGAGIGVQRQSIGTIIRYNDVSNNDAGIESAGYPDDVPSGTEVHYNNIVGNLEYGVASIIWGEDPGVPEEVDATLNWWGDPSGPDGAQDFGPETYTGVLPGTGDSVSGNVKCQPWLTRPFKTVLEDDIAYFGISSPALKGWNIVSAPLALDENVIVTVKGVEYTANTWGGLQYLGKIAEGDKYALKLHYTVEDGVRVYSPIYYYDSDPDSVDPGWRKANEFTEINPVDAFYIRMMESDSIPILFSPDRSVPSKELYKGWNLVGCAYMSVLTEEEGLALETALATIESVSSPTGDVTGYDQVVSPSMNQPSWTFIPGPEGGTYIPESVEGETILIGKGYWVFMENPGTLAGLTFTPISLPK